MAARTRKVRARKLPEPAKDKQVKHGLEELSVAANDAIREVLASYLTTPDTLREMVREEIARTVRDKVDRNAYSDEKDPFLERVMAEARTLALEEYNNEENFNLFVAEMKARYLEELKRLVRERIKSRAYLDAHDVYERAWRSYGKR